MLMPHKSAFFRVFNKKLIRSGVIGPVWGSVGADLEGKHGKQV